MQVLPGSKTLLAERKPASQRKHLHTSACRSRLVVRAFLFDPPGRPQTKNIDQSGSTADATYKRSVDVLLNRAASSLARGPCTCLSCRGVGAVRCPHCTGSGHMSSEAVARSQMLRGAFRRLRSALGLLHDVPYATSEWVQTNRCTRCHGSGHLPCELCSASGLRYPYLTKDHWRQCAGQPGASGCGPDNACNID